MATTSISVSIPSMASAGSGTPVEQGPGGVKWAKRVDIFAFWRRIGPSARQHPDDCNVLNRTAHCFDLRCLPGSYYGRLRDAPVVLLFLSPGFSDSDLADAKSKAGQLRYARTRRGYEPLPSREAHEGAYRWLKSITSVFGNYDHLRSKIAVLEINPYHSMTFKDEPLLAALPSCRASIVWAQEVLFPQAIAGRRIVICLRAARHWGLCEGKRYGKALFAPYVTRRGYMRRRQRMRAEIIKLVRKRGGT